MRIVFSRKGFDSASGGFASPILDGRPISLPIPTEARSSTSFDALGLGQLVERVSRGAIKAPTLCHPDPDLVRGAFGQAGAAQTHLDRQGVEEGDVFLFFGLFAELDAPAARAGRTADARPHHRIFGWLQIGERVRLGSDGSWARSRFPDLARHPHLGPGWPANNTLYRASPELRVGGATTRLPGVGAARRACGRLRLSTPEGPTSSWLVPDWLHPTRGGVGMSCHGKAERWPPDRCRTAPRGQEFVADAGARTDAAAWLVATVREMAAG